MPRSSLCWLRTGRRKWNNLTDIPEAPRIAGNFSWQLLQFYLQWRKNGDFQNLLGLSSDWICDLETAIKTSWHIVGWKPVSNMWFGVRCGWRNCSDRVYSVFLTGLKGVRMSTALTPCSTCSVYSAAGRCVGHEASRARQRQITSPHPKAPSQGVSNWMEQSWGIKLTTAFSESWNLFFHVWTLNLGSEAWRGKAVSCYPKYFFCF